MMGVVRKPSRSTPSSRGAGSGVGLMVVLLAGALLAATAAPVAHAQRSGREVFSQEELCRQNYQTGEEYYKNQRLHNAAEAFTEVKEACPDMIDAYMRLGSIQVSLKDYDEAIDTYHDALDQDPGNLDVKELLAYAMSAAEELDDAILLYRELHDARPENTDIVRNLAFVYQKKGLVAEALMLYNLLVELGSADARMVSEAGRMALEKKLYLPAVTFYKTLHESNPEDVGTLGILGNYYWKIRFYERAIPYYNELLRLAPDHAQALRYHMLRADCCRRDKNYECAIEDYLWILERQPEEPNNYYNLGLAYNGARRYDDTIDAVRRGLEIDPNAGDLYYLWGRALEGKARLIEKSRFDEAIRLFEEAKEKFRKVIEKKGRTANTARQQIERMDQLIERVLLLKEQAEQP